MIPLDDETHSFIAWLQAAYLEQRDLEAVLSCMDPRVSWIGTGEGELGRNLEEAMQVLAKEQQDYFAGFRLTTQQIDVLALPGHVSVAYGFVKAVSEDSSVADFFNRFSAVCLKTDAGMRLLHLHLSRPDADQRPNASFPLKQDMENRLHMNQRIAEADRALHQREQELAILTENAPGGLHQCRHDSCLTLMRMSNSFLTLFGYSQEEVREMFHNHFLEMIFPEDQARVREDLDTQLVQGYTVSLEYRVQRKDGTFLWILDRGKLVTEADGAHSFFCILLDITARKREQEALRLSLERHQIIMNQTTDIIFEWDITTDILTCSNNWNKKFGYDPIQTDISHKIPQSSNIHPHDMSAFMKIMRDSAAGMPYSETEFRIRNVLGHFTWCKIRATVQFNLLHQPVKAVGVILDIDAEKKQKQRLLELAEHDSLTGLLNKSTTKKRVDDWICQRGGTGTLMMLDLDDYKQVNDQFGHLCGDAVLADVAGVLKRIFRADDVVGRIGGDEFLVFVPSLRRKQAEAKAQSILQAVRAIPLSGGGQGMLSCSVGFADLPGDAEDFYSLYCKADRALYYVKNHGKGDYCAYRPDMECESMDNCAPRTAVGTAIDSDASSSNEHLAQYCFHLLFRAADVNTSISHVLELVGRAYDISQIVIFEALSGSTQYHSTFTWHNMGATPHPSASTASICLEHTAGYPPIFDENGVFYCTDLTTLPPDLQSRLAQRGICATLQCAMLEEHELKGFISFEEFRDNRAWNKAQKTSLTLIANVITTFLLKSRLKKPLQAPSV